MTVTVTQPEALGSTVICHTPTMTTPSLRTDTESSPEEYNSEMDHQINPVGKGLTMVHDLTATHECWCGRVFEAIKSFPLAWQHNLSLLQQEGAGFNSKEWRLWRGWGRDGLGVWD